MKKSDVLGILSMSYGNLLIPIDVWPGSENTDVNDQCFLIKLLNGWDGQTLAKCWILKGKEHGHARDWRS